MALFLKTSPYILIRETRKNSDFKLFDFLTNKNYSISPNIAAVLKAGLQPKDEAFFIQKLNKETVDWLVEARFLLNEQFCWEVNNIDTLEIETSTYCNWRCEYCPQRYAQLPPNTMDISLFELILQQAKQSGQIRYITLNSYNEPTILPDFEKYLQYIDDYGFKLRLFTNATGLNQERIAFLKNRNLLDKLFINIPSLDETKFKEMTGSSQYHHTIKIIHFLLEEQIPLELSVQGLSGNKESELKAIRTHWPNIAISQWPTTDRSGMVMGEYHKQINNRYSEFGGCYHIMNSLCIDCQGNYFICCEDYNKQSKYSTVYEIPVAEMLKSEKLQSIRKIIFGFDIAPDDFICRKCEIMKFNIRFAKSCYLRSDKSGDL